MYKVELRQSEIKSAIVSKYFVTWAKIIVNSQKKLGGEDRIGYIDLYAGPGTYSDGTDSTPLLILKSAIQDEDIRNRLVTAFNDVNKSSTKILKQNIKNIPEVMNLKHKPTVSNFEVGEDVID